jgi:predicted transcriptional regulator
MVKALGLNIGTLRYHLMILALNHRVIPYNDGPRLVRYFENKGTYTPDQMMVLSLLKRDPTSRLLGAMSGNDAMTGSQISADSGLSYSDINRYFKELVAKGVVIKESTGVDRYQYSISPEYKGYIAKNLRR